MCRSFLSHFFPYCFKLIFILLLFIFGDKLLHLYFLFFYLIFDSLNKGYEILAKKNIDKNKKFPLLNTYIISAETYNKIMPLAIHLYNYSINNNFFEHGHNFQDQGGIFERVMAFLVGQEADFFEMCSIIHFAKQT
jgi:hypothetical protein